MKEFFENFEIRKRKPAQKKTRNAKKQLKSIIYIKYRISSITRGTCNNR